MTRHGTNQHTCGACHRPMTDHAYLCLDCIDDPRDGFAALLDKLTARTIGGEHPRSPLTATIPGPRHGLSTAWDTPRAEAANYPRMLREATARQTRFGTQVRAKASGHPDLRVDYRTGSDLNHLKTVMSRIAVDVHHVTSTGPDHMTWGGVAIWVNTHLHVLRFQPSAPAHYGALKRCLEAAERHIDRPPGRLYLGPCDQPAVTCPCPGAYLASDESKTAECDVCRTTVLVADRKRHLRDQAEDMWLTACEIENLSAALGDRIPDSTVSSWHKQRRITGTRPWVKEEDRSRDRRQDPVRFLFGDVLVLLEERRARKEGTPA